MRPWVSVTGWWAAPSRDGVWQSAQWTRNILVAPFRAESRLRDTTKASRSPDSRADERLDPNLQTGRHHDRRLATRGRQNPDAALDRA
jgi:hypothetical protein